MTETLRVDKWLWFARFARTRTSAARIVTEARFRVNGQPTDKAHYAIRAGDVLTFALGPHIRIIKVVALALRRGGAPEARLLYEDLDPSALANLDVQRRGLADDHHIWLGAIEHLGEGAALDRFFEHGSADSHRTR